MEVDIDSRLIGVEIVSVNNAKTLKRVLNLVFKLNKGLSNFTPDAFYLKMHNGELFRD